MQPHRLLPVVLAVAAATACRETVTAPATPRHEPPRGVARSTTDALGLPPILDLGTLASDGSGWSGGIAINSHGLVVGWSNLNNFLWDASSRTMRFLGNPWGDWSAASGINENDWVVGRTAYVPWIWDTQNGMRSIDLSQNTATSAVCKGGASGINIAGQVTGLEDNCSYSQGFVYEGATNGPLNLIPGFFGAEKINDLGQVIHANQIYDYRSGTVTTLPTLGNTTIAYDINNKGQVAGSSFAGGVEHAFIWSPSAGMTDLGLLCGADKPSRANGLNESGLVVGWCTNGNGLKRAVLWNPSANTMTELGSLPGFCCSVAADISDNGLIVGTSGVNDVLVILGSEPGEGHNPIYPNGVEHATLWTAPPTVPDPTQSVDLANSCGHAITGIAFDGTYYYVAEGHNALTQCITRYTASGVKLEYKQFDVDMRGLHFVPSTGKLMSRTWAGRVFEIDYAAGTWRPLTSFAFNDPSHGVTPGTDQSQPAADADGLSFWTWNNTTQNAERRLLSDGSITQSLPVLGGYHDVPAIAVSNNGVYMQNGNSIYIYDRSTGQLVATATLTASTAGCQGGYGFGVPAAGDRVMYDVDCNHARVEAITPVNVTPDLPTTSTSYGRKLDAGFYYNCATRADGSVECWGENPYGQQNIPGTERPTLMSAGFASTCTLRADASVVCWGSDGSGQVNVPPGPFASVSSGGYGVCGLRPNATVICWTTGQPPVPDGAYRDVSAGSGRTCAVHLDGTLVCTNPSYIPPIFPPAGQFLRVSTGGSHACGIRTDGSIACWGGNAYGELDNIPTGVFTEVAAGENHTCALRNDGAVFCWGQEGPAIHPQPDNQPFVHVTSGEFHTCALRPSGKIVCWGQNDKGQLNVPADLADVLPLSATLAKPSGGPEGSTIAFDASGTSGGVAPLKYSWDFDGDGVVDATSASPTISHLYADNAPNNGRYNVILTVTDAAGHSSSATASVNITNVPPTINYFAVGASYYTAQGVLNFSDPSGALDIVSNGGFMATIDWNDGASTLWYPALTAAGQYFSSPTHTYVKGGFYNVTITLQDKDGGTATKSVQYEQWEIPAIAVSPTTVKRNTNTLSVGIAGSQYFDGRNIDIASVQLNNTPVLLVKGQPQCATKLNTTTGFYDLGCQFDVNQMKASGNLPTGTNVGLTLRGTFAPQHSHFQGIAYITVQ